MVWIRGGGVRRSRGRRRGRGGAAGPSRSVRLGGADVEVEAAPGGTSERVGDNGGRGINRRTATVALGRSERVRERGKVDLGEERRKWEWGADEARRLGLIPSARADGVARRSGGDRAGARLGRVNRGRGRPRGGVGWAVHCSNGLQVHSSS